MPGSICSIRGTMHKIKITDVRAIPADSAFLIDDGTTAILYDSGFAFTGYQVAENIRKALGERPLDYIFLTHSHYDHALGSVYVKRRYPEAKVVAGEYAGKIFAKPTARAIMRDLDQKFAKTCGVETYEDLIDEIHADILVNDGDVIRAGEMAFTVVALPGHTKCSVGFYLPENRLLLGAETLGVYIDPETVIPSYLIGYEITMNSIAKAECMEIDAILVPHHGLLEGSAAQNYLKNGRSAAQATAAELTDCLKNGGTDADAFALFTRKYYSDHVRELYPIDAMTLNTNIMINLLRSELL